MLIKPGKYTFRCILAVDEKAEQFLTELVTKKSLVYKGMILALHDVSIKEVRKGANKNCARILTLGLGHDCSDGG